MKLLFAHGWGFGSAFWEPLANLLADMPQAIDDCGYFGAPRACRVEGPCLAITHSYGTMRVLADPPPGLVGIVAINGFERFTARPDRAGVPVRVVDRMLRRFGEDPRAVLAEFRRQCGAGDGFGEIDADLLRTDLLRLRDAQPPLPAVPVLSLQGARDPLLPEAMRAAVFAGAAVSRIESAAGGHLLPLEAPELCAGAVRGMIGHGA
ncbi:MAG: alpha/beta hydrolase [Novosphingobium sp.]|uniref:alpha/beta fold hydrolase n=1 Tax=Novosphingobium sp. TaxID=1874826 RepID=UPI0012CABAE2|nr:alpha/beta fold hydrolase [Novosphingobium sp.]MPS67856.1 alpha/beta hydrolase [Novosphingobium sp.]